MSRHIMMLTAFNKAMFLVTRVALVLITLAITCPISIILGMDPPPNIVVMLIEGMDKSLGDVLCSMAPWAVRISGQGPKLQ